MGQNESVPNGPPPEVVPQLENTQPNDVPVKVIKQEMISPPRPPRKRAATEEAKSKGSSNTMDKQSTPDADQETRQKSSIPTIPPQEQPEVGTAQSSRTRAKATKPKNMESKVATKPGKKSAKSKDAAKSSNSSESVTSVHTAIETEINHNGSIPIIASDAGEGLLEDDSDQEDVGTNGGELSIEQRKRWNIVLDVDRKMTRKEDQEMEKKGRIVGCGDGEEEMLQYQKKNEQQYNVHPIPCKELGNRKTADKKSLSELQSLHDAIPIFVDKTTEDGVSDSDSNLEQVSLEQAQMYMKQSRHGSWKYIPLDEDPVHYPTASRKKKSNATSRELNKLAMDVVGSQHGLEKNPSEWYTGSEFDPNRGICMADRIKSNRRRVKPTIKVDENSREKAAIENEKKTSRRGRKKLAKDASTSVDSSASLYSVSTAIDPDNVPTHSSMSLESSPFHHDQLMNNAHIGQESSLMNIGHQGRVFPSQPTTYSFPSVVHRFSTELPEDILEESNEDIVEMDDTISSASSPLKKILPTDDDLYNINYRFNEDGVHYRSQLLIIRPITIDTNMEELVREQERQDMWIVPVRRPRINENGQVVLIYRNADSANHKLESNKMVLDGLMTIVERPGAFLVQYELHSMMGEESFRELIVSTFAKKTEEHGDGTSILHMEPHPLGAIVVLSSIDKASEYLRAGYLGSLTFSTLANEQKIDSLLAWPRADKEWAMDLGL